jgi:hypothetical protein
LIAEVAKGFLGTAYDWLYERGCYTIGKVVLRMLTLGKYPPPQDLEHAESFVSVVGVIVLVLVVIAFVIACVVASPPR